MIIFFQKKTKNFELICKLVNTPGVVRDVLSRALYLNESLTQSISHPD